MQTLDVWGRVRYLSVTEALHNTEFHEWMWKKHLCFFRTAKTGKRAPNSGVKGANHYLRAPDLWAWKTNEGKASRIFADRKIKEGKSLEEVGDRTCTSALIPRWKRKT